MFWFFVSFWILLGGFHLFLVLNALIEKKGIEGWKWNGWRFKRERPKVRIASRNGVYVLVREKDYRRAKAWHNQGYKNGYLLWSDPIVVKPIYISYDQSVLITHRERTFSSSSFENDLEPIIPYCDFQVSREIYVPFSSNVEKVLERDKILFPERKNIVDAVHDLKIKVA